MHRDAMPKYYVSTYLAREASTVYEVDDDGSFRAVSPQGQEHRGTGGPPAGTTEIGSDEALRLMAERAASLKDHEKEGPGPAACWPVYPPVEGLLQDGVVTDAERARDAWRKDGWG
jgi:hypothetical protein